jgi:hypothetical protein
MGTASLSTFSLSGMRERAADEQEDRESKPA